MATAELAAAPTGAVVARGAATIYSPTFDRTLLVAPLAVGLLAAVAVVVDPRLYAPLLFADLWLLGYHHVVATYTRLAFDAKSLVRHRFLAVDLLILVTVGTSALAFTAGAWVVASAFLYLQWFHYMRQGYGIARLFYRATAAGQARGSRDVVADAVIYLVPTFGIAARSASLGETFLALPVKSLALPPAAIAALGTLAAMAVTAWLLRVVRDVKRGALAPAYEAFIASHIVVFYTAYVAVEDANVGWLAINVWHNLQYVLVVWMSNARRFSGGIDPEARFLSRISQPGRVASYFGCCLAISTLLYLALARVSTAVLGGGLAVSLGIYMGINFHHYLVDALIWRRKPTSP